MPKKKNTRQQRTRFRTGAAAARHRRQKRRQSILSGAVASAIVVAIVALIVGIGGGSKTTTTTTTPSTTTPSTTTPADSVAGKPCVKVTGALPPGAPAVPVQTGPPPKALVTKDLKAGATLTVDYIGVACSTGKIFDSSYSRNQPATFPLGQVIGGWQQGLPGMRVGGERLLGIPPALAYGTKGSPPQILPDETLWFVVHVRSAK